MTAAGELLRDEICRAGPIPFRRFMEIALYHPEAGYYRRQRDPFGKDGDFFTAEQVQPVFGILIAAVIRKFYEAMDAPDDFTVLELGAGRGEMAEALGKWRYLGLDIGRGTMPTKFRGVVFANEFFDALPMDAVIFRDGRFRERRVAAEAGRFQWVTGGEVREETVRYLSEYFPPPEEGRIYEVNFDALAWIDRIAQSLESGFVLTIDYGFTRPEAVRFPLGTLMGYRRHIAREDVLDEPGERDITAHVNFSALQEYGAMRGLGTERLENLAKTLLLAGEADQFAAALGGESGPDLRRRMQLKTLLFGMGETFRTLIQKCRGADAEK